MLQLGRHVFGLQVISVQLLGHHAVELLQLTAVLIQILRRLDESGLFDQLIGLVAEKGHDFALVFHSVDRADGLLVIHQNIDRVVILLRGREDLFHILEFLT